jgi:hypothetical protein
VGRVGIEPDQLSKSLAKFSATIFRLQSSQLLRCNIYSQLSTN